MNSGRVIAMTALLSMLVACTSAVDDERDRQRGGTNAGATDEPAGSTDASADAREGVAALTRIAFADAAGGPRIMLAGTDPREELESV